MVGEVQTSLPPEGVLQSLCSPAGSEEEGKGYLGSEGLGQGTLSIEGALLFCIQFWSGSISLCSKQDSPEEQRPQKARGLETAIVVLNKHFSDHLESLH